MYMIASQQQNVYFLPILYCVKDVYSVCLQCVYIWILDFEKKTTHTRQRYTFGPADSELPATFYC